MCFDNNVFHFVSEAGVPCDDASGNIGYSKSTISSGDKDIANDEVALTLESSTATPAKHLVSYTHTIYYVLVHVTIKCHI